MLSPFRMVCRDFILPESANYVSFYPSSFLRNLSYLILIQARSPEKCIKIAKTAGNKAFLAVFTVFVGVQFAPSERSRGVPDAGI